MAGTRTLDADEVTMLAADGMTEFHYDDYELFSGPLCANGIGRLCAVFWNLGLHETLFQASIDWVYDARGNLVQQIRSFSLEGQGFPLLDLRIIKRSYNALNQVTSVEYGDAVVGEPQTRTVTTYDRRGLPDTVTWEPPGGPPQLLADFTRNAAGVVTLAESGDYVRDWLYDPNGRVLADIVGAGSSFEMSELITYYGADDVRELVSERTGLPTHITEFRYDSRHQLTVAKDDGGYSGEFSYSRAGRLTSVRIDGKAGGKKKDKDKKPKKVKKGSTAVARDVTYEYAGTDPEAVTALIDPDGEDYARYDYTDAGGIKTRKSPAGNWTFAYDGYDRQRIARNLDEGTSELYYYGLDGERWLALTLDSDGNPERLRFWFGPTEIWYDGAGTELHSWAHVSLGSPIARIENQTDLEYTFHNGLGHLMATFDPVNAETTAYTYGPFGEILDQTGDTDHHLRRFNGKELDETSGLSYYGYRYYDPLALVWTRADPLYRFAPDLAYDEPRLMNLYAFSLNNPLRFVDPDGESPDAQGALATAGALCVAAGPGCGAAIVAATPFLVAVATTGGVAYIIAVGGADTRVGGGLGCWDAASCIDAEEAWQRAVDEERYGIQRRKERIADENFRTRMREMLNETAEGQTATDTPHGGERSQADQDRLDAQRRRRAEQREAKSRRKTGQNPKGNKKKLKKGKSGKQKRKARQRRRERNVGVDEEHSRTRKGKGKGLPRKVPPWN